eukprot:CAMPEP_0119508288 /NCGR_PEP_ID=MMETSP1344-20130328/27942_1 /TAXON_ID=236787 /ORGANISM="Florenciella parvula, Strain CCMP2471" /LENGTH=129 /DNA_ID=CAMNT_0007545015 /DNA_START=163 /DNA_END=553 /DNA_ORIENTATION=+
MWGTVAQLRAYGHAASWFSAAFWRYGASLSLTQALGLIATPMQLNGAKKQSEVDSEVFEPPRKLKAVRLVKEGTFEEDRAVALVRKGQALGVALFQPVQIPLDVVHAVNVSKLVVVNQLWLVLVHMQAA